MDTTVAELIGSMGFPIVACCAMGWFINTAFKEFQSLMIENNMLIKTLTDYLMGKDARNEEKGKDGTV